MTSPTSTSTIDSTSLSHISASIVQKPSGSSVTVTTVPQAIMSLSSAVSMTKTWVMPANKGEVNVPSNSGSSTIAFICSSSSLWPPSARKQSTSSASLAAGVVVAMGVAVPVASIVDVAVPVASVVAVALVC